MHEMYKTASSHTSTHIKMFSVILRLYGLGFTGIDIVFKDNITYYQIQIIIYPDTTNFHTIWYYFHGYDTEFWQFYNNLTLIFTEYIQ